MEEKLGDYFLYDGLAGGGVGTRGPPKAIAIKSSHQSHRDLLFDSHKSTVSSLCLTLELRLRDFARLTTVTSD